MQPIIKLEGVDFYYDKGKPSEVHALRNISLEIQRGEYVSFFGPSGCGKSTILYTIAGVERPDLGKVIINGQDLMTFSPKELAIYRQIGIGIIFQSFNLIPSIKNIDNVTLPMAFLGISPEKRRQAAMNIFNKLNIADLAERFPYELSGGQQQRVGIARALANNPPIILADEPIGNLDSANAVNVLDLLRDLNKKEGKTVIVVTHEAWSLRDTQKVFYMRDGAMTKVESHAATMTPSKKVGESYYYERLFPELPAVESRAKTLAALMLRGYSQQEIGRLEYFLTQRIKNNIDEEVFRGVLDRPYRDGGVGLWKGRARQIAEHVEKIIEEEKELENIYKKLSRNPDAPLMSEVEKLRSWLFEGTEIKLSPIQMDRLNEVMTERIRNIITAQNFSKVMNLPKDKGGVGLRISTGLRVAEKLELILGRDASSLDKALEEMAVK